MERIHLLWNIQRFIDQFFSYFYAFFHCVRSNLKGKRRVLLFFLQINTRGSLRNNTTMFSLISKAVQKHSAFLNPNSLPFHNSIIRTQHPNIQKQLYPKTGHSPEQTFLHRPPFAAIQRRGFIVTSWEKLGDFAMFDPKFRSKLALLLSIIDPFQSTEDINMCLNKIGSTD